MFPLMAPWACRVCHTTIPYKDYDRVLRGTAYFRRKYGPYVCRTCKVELLPAKGGETLIVGTRQPPADEKDAWPHDSHINSRCSLQSR